MALDWVKVFEGAVASGPVATVLGVWIYKLHQTLDSKDRLLKEWADRFILETEKSSQTYRDLTVSLTLLREMIKGSKG